MSSIKGPASLVPSFLASLLLHLLVLAIPRALQDSPTDGERRLPLHRPLVARFVGSLPAPSGSPEPELVVAAAEADVEATVETTAEIAPLPDHSIATETLPPSTPVAQASEPSFLHYLAPEQLTEMPQILELGNLEPPGVIKPGDQGILVFDLLLNDQGKVDGIRVVATSVPPLFLDNTLQVFRRAGYKPGQELNRPMASRLRVEVTLKPDVGARIPDRVRVFPSDSSPQ